MHFGNEWRGSRDRSHGRIVPMLPSFRIFGDVLKLQVWDTTGFSDHRDVSHNV
jgi:hypothetical protein